MNTETETQAAVVATVEAGQSAPATTEAGQQPEQQGAESGQAAQPEDAGNEGDEGQQQPRKRPRWSDVNQARREADAARREAERLREMVYGQQPQQAQPSPATAAEKPTREAFDFDEERYEDAMFEWRLKQREQKTELTKAQQQIQEARERFVEAQEEFAASHEDYDDVVSNPALHITQAMALAVHESEIGPQIAYHLGKNPAEAARIAALSPLSQAREIGRIESKLTAEGAKPRPPKPTKTTSAPPPPPTVRASAPVKRQESEMTDEERMAAIRAAR